MNSLQANNRPASADKPLCYNHDSSARATMSRICKLVVPLFMVLTVVNIPGARADFDLTSGIGRSCYAKCDASIPKGSYSSKLCKLSCALGISGSGTKTCNFGDAPRYQNMTSRRRGD